MAKLSAQEFIEAIKEMTVLELNDLVKACEDVPVWNPSGKCKDKLAENHSGGYYLFHSVLCDLYIYDQEI